MADTTTRISTDTYLVRDDVCQDCAMVIANDDGTSMGEDREAEVREALDRMIRAHDVAAFWIDSSNPGGLADFECGVCFRRSIGETFTFYLEAHNG